MLFGRLLGLLLEPARDPLRDELGSALDDLAALRRRLQERAAQCGVPPAALAQPLAEIGQAEQRLAAALVSYRNGCQAASARHAGAALSADLRHTLDAALARAAAIEELLRGGALQPENPEDPVFTAEPAEKIHNP